MQKLVTILNTLEAIDVNFYNFRINLCLTLPRVTSIDGEPVLINTNTLLAKPPCTLRLHQPPFNLFLVDSFLIFFKLWNYFEYLDNIIYVGMNQAGGANSFQIPDCSSYLGITPRWRVLSYHQCKWQYQINPDKWNSISVKISYLWMVIISFR